ncbi:timeless-domain-containing protein [Trametes coccinea BRFM310]|uniref:Timeless-domain-containing protein n=1 Tax=Trametes coccinea (strain BRFM310) TaxID=1353009 RepID=A0A1Y2IIT6_TRAC3|nr:timeless-domain-containing protein [Trametes coccinea BRFM310]
MAVVDFEDAISGSEGSGDEPYIDRRAILEPPIQSVVDALGGYENGVYRLGDECYGCLKDLKKFWRKDDTDDDRTVARIFWATGVLSNDLVPILLETAGKGPAEDKRAIACVDLLTAMTWPIDLAEELKELDDEFDRGTNYTQLLYAHLNYKAALLRPGVFKALLAVTLPCLAREPKERKERDMQIVNVVLHLIRNLAFIKDPPPNMYGSADQAEFSTLQSKLVKRLSESHLTDLLLTIASNASDSMFNQWNTVVLEIFYLLYRGIKPSSLASDQAKQSTKALQSLLAVEDQRKREFARKATSRHSRFGTTISVMLNSKKGKPSGDEGPVQETPNPDADAGPSRAYVLHKQQALNKDSGSALDMISAKKHRASRGKKVDELGRDDNLSLDARVILQDLARSFIESCFNPLLASLLKDIKAERPKITEKDHLRLLFVTKWFLEFFLYERARQPESSRWKFGLVAEVIDRSWIVWVLRRMREAQEEKPKLWTELQAGIECLTQFVLIIDAMASQPPAPPKASDAGHDIFSEADKDAEEDVADAARLLQQQIVYNGEVLDIAFESIRTYKEGTQSLAYLDATVHLAYSLLRTLEKWSKRQGKGEMYVRRKAKPKKKRTGKTTEEGEGVPDVEEEEPQEEEEEVIDETMFTFDQFEQRFVHSDVTHTLLVYLGRYKEFTSLEQMKRVVGLMHRQAVKQKAEGLYFMVSTLYLFKEILAQEKSLPKEQPYKDLVALINYILRKFFKSVAEDSFLVVEAFFPKNRGHWKQFSSLELDQVGKRPEREPFDSRFPPDVQVKKGYTLSEQIGIVVAELVSKNQRNLVEWTKQILSLAIAHRQRIIDDVDGAPSKTIDLTGVDSGNESHVDAMLGRRPPSTEALAKINDYLIPYVSDEEAEAANKNAHLKLLFRLCNFKLLDEDADELEWYIPSAILPVELKRTLSTIDRFLETPIDLQGKSPSELITKKRRRRVRRRRSPSPGSDGEDSDAPRRKKRERKKKEEKQYKSAQFIEDSDFDDGDMEAFLAKERALRERAARLAEETGNVGTMRAHGTKKRRRKGKDAAGKKRRKRSGQDGDDDGEERGASDAEKAQESNASSDESDFNVFGSPKRDRAEPTPDTSPPMEDSEEQPKRTSRTRPRPRLKAASDVASSPKMAASPPSIVESGTKGVTDSLAGIMGPNSSGPEVLADSDDDIPSARGLRGKQRSRLVIADDDEDE